MIEIYTDGSNVHNGFPHSYGGYGYVIKIHDELVTGGGSMQVNKIKPVTNNRAELLAIIEALNVVLSSDLTDISIQLYSDSQWCVKCANGEWSMKKNIDLWTQFNKTKKECLRRNIALSIQWVKGHDGLELNEMADDIAGSYCKKAKPSSVAT